MCMKRLSSQKAGFYDLGPSTLDMRPATCDLKLIRGLIYMHRIKILLFPVGTLFLVATLSAQTSPNPPKLEFAFEVRAKVADPTVVGQLPTGTRRIIEILGGTFAGPKLKGKLLPGGADWQIIRQDGFTEVDARYTLQTEKGDLIYVSNIGIRHAPPEILKRLNEGEAVDQSQIYFRAVPKFETASPELEWLMRSIFICTGERHPNDVVIRFFRVL